MLAHLCAAFLPLAAVLGFPGEGFVALKDASEASTTSQPLSGSSPTTTEEWATTRTTALAPGTPTAEELERLNASRQSLAHGHWWPRDAVISAGQCPDRFVVPPEPPEQPTGYNGLRLPDACFNRTDREHHVFVVGDWGGVLRSPGSRPEPADRRSRHDPEHHREFVPGADDIAQVSVARQMELRAAQSSPEYVLNMGDNFYWGGVLVKCGAPPYDHDPSGQWTWVFERVYDGPALKGVQWLGVLGNHDFGGFLFTHGWDQAIGYTWSRMPGSTGRWVTPAMYYSARVNYPGFSVDYFFLDSNVFDAKDPDDADHAHNLCSRKHNLAQGATCGVQGPISVDECPVWFQRLWDAQMVWLERGLEASSTDWQVAITHFPPIHGQRDWTRLSAEHGLDLLVMGHVHEQQVLHMEEENFLRPTAYIISGGGGGITSESTPRTDGRDDQYGFMDLTFSHREIRIEAISHGGHLRKQVCVRQRPRRGLPFPPGPTGLSLCDPSATTTTATRTVSATTTSSEVVGAALDVQRDQSQEESTSAEPLVVDVGVELLMTVVNMDFSGLHARHGLLDSFKSALQDAVASAAGPGVEPRAVALQLSPGSVAVLAAVPPPRGVELHELRAHLAGGLPALGQDAAGRLAILEGVGEVCVGEVEVAAAMRQGAAGVPPPARLKLDSGAGAFHDARVLHGTCAALAALALALVVSAIARSAVPKRSSQGGSYTALPGSADPLQRQQAPSPATDESSSCSEYTFCQADESTTDAEQAEKDTAVFCERVRGNASTARGRDHAACWIKALSAALRAHPSSSDVQEHALGALHNICQGDDASSRARRRRAEEADAIAHAATALGEHPACSLVQAQACGLIGQLCAGPWAECESRRELAAEADVLEKLVSALEGHSSDDEVQAQACRALGEGCSGAGAAAAVRRERAAAAGAIEAAAAALQRRRAKPTTQEQACYALFCVCHGEDDEGAERQARAVGVGAMEAAVAALRSSPVSTTVQERGCALLAGLCSGPGAPNRRQRAAAAGAIEAVVAALQAHVAHAGVTNEGCQALAAICNGGDCGSALRRERAASVGACQVLSSVSCAHDELAAVRTLAERLHQSLADPLRNVETPGQLQWPALGKKEPRRVPPKC